MGRKNGCSGRSVVPALVLCPLVILGLLIAGASAAAVSSGSVQKIAVITAVPVQKLAVVTLVPVTATTVTCDNVSQCMSAAAANATWGPGGYVQTSVLPCGYVSGYYAAAPPPEYCFSQKPVAVLVVSNLSAVPVTTTPQPCPAILSVASSPSGALVSIDGITCGTTPFGRARIDAGRHQVTVSLAGYQPVSETISLLCDNVYARNYSLIAVPAGSGVAVAANNPPVPDRPVPIRQVPLPPANQSAVPPAITGNVTDVPAPPQTTGAIAGTCSRHYRGSGDLSSDPDGRLNCTTLIGTDDGIAVITLPAGTLVTGRDGKPVPAIQVVQVALSEMPESTDNMRPTGTAYRFLPDHTVFDPPVLVSFTLGEESWERWDPANLSIRETAANGTGYDVLPTTIDPATRTVSAPVRHFSIIGLFSAGPGTDPFGPLPGIIREAAGPSRGHLPLTPLIPDAYAPLAAVACGIVVSLVGSLVSASATAARVWDRITSLVQNFLGSETVGLVSTSEIEKRGIKPSGTRPVVLLGLSLREILVVVISTIGFAAAFLLADRVDLDLVTVAVFLGAGGIATILHDLAHKFCATRCGCVTEYQFWSLGTVTMLATAWFFGNAFAKPSRSVIRGRRPLLPEEAARIRLAGPLMSMGIALGSLFLIPFGGLFAVAGSAGFSMNLLNSVFSLVPVKPNDGVEIFAWNRLVWAGTFIPLLIFFLYIYLSA